MGTMQRCDIVSEFRKLQAILVDRHSAQTLQDISQRSVLLHRGSICPPLTEFVDPFSRVNVLLFWHMTHLLEAMTQMLQDHDPALARLSTLSMVDHLQEAYCAHNIQHNPIYEALSRVCDRAQTHDSPAAGM